MPVDIGSGVKAYEQNPHFGLKLYISIIRLKYYVLRTCTCTSETRVGFFSVGISDYLHFYSDINVQRMNPRVEQTKDNRRIRKKTPLLEHEG